METAGSKLEPGISGGGGDGGADGGGGNGGGADGGTRGGGAAGGGWIGGGGDGAAKANVETATETTLSMVTPSSVEKAAADVPRKVAAALSAADTLGMMSCALMAMVGWVDCEQHDMASGQEQKDGLFVQSPLQSQYCAAGSPGHETAPGGLYPGTPGLGWLG